MKDGSLRLQKFLALAGVASRRGAEEFISAGRVSVNNRVVQKMGVVVDPAADVVKVDGCAIKAAKHSLYFVLNKPRKVVTTLDDPEGRPTVRALLPPGLGRLFPVGRLDWDTEGVILLTNDGLLAHRLAHPSFSIERTYHAKVRGKVEHRVLRRLSTGVRLEEGMAKAEKARFLRGTGTNSWISVTLREGRHHEVKRLLKTVGHPVQKLKRVSFAGLGTGTLRLGEYRPLTEEEVSRLRRQVGI